MLSMRHHVNFGQTFCWLLRAMTSFAIGQHETPFCCLSVFWVSLPGISKTLGTWARGYPKHGDTQITVTVPSPPFPRHSSLSFSFFLLFSPVIYPWFNYDPQQRIHYLQTWSLWLKFTNNLEFSDYLQSEEKLDIHIAFRSTNRTEITWETSLAWVDNAVVIPSESEGRVRSRQNSR